MASCTQDTLIKYEPVVGATTILFGVVGGATTNGVTLLIAGLKTENIRFFFLNYQQQKCSIFYEC